MIERRLTDDDQVQHLREQQHQPYWTNQDNPEENDMVAKVGLAIYSCANFPFGFFNAYGNSARKDNVDFVVHLGDYIYEYAGDGDYGYGYSIDRIPKPESIIYTLQDYRQRHATYRTDKDLLLSHQTHPWIPVSARTHGGN